MLNRHVKLAVIFAFGVLGLFYAASLAATVIRIGPSELLEAVFRVPDFIVLLIARIIQVLGCIAIVVLSFGSDHRFKACGPLAFVLVFSGAVILTADALSAPGIWGIPWSIALAGMALHVVGAFWAVRLSSREAL